MLINYCRSRGGRLFDPVQHRMGAGDIIAVEIRRVDAAVPIRSPATARPQRQ